MKHYTRQSINIANFHLAYLVQVNKPNLQMYLPQLMIRNEDENMFSVYIVISNALIFPDFLLPWSSHRIFVEHARFTSPAKLARVRTLAPSISNNTPNPFLSWKHYACLLIDIARKPGKLGLGCKTGKCSDTEDLGMRPTPASCAIS